MNKKTPRSDSSIKRSFIERASQLTSTPLIIHEWQCRQQQHATVAAHDPSHLNFTHHFSDGQAVSWR